MKSPHVRDDTTPTIAATKSNSVSKDNASFNVAAIVKNDNSTNGLLAQGEGLPDGIPNGVNQASEDHSSLPFELEASDIDDYSHLKVAVIGAGIAGITAGILLPIKVPQMELTILEKNNDVGGTWLENTYPGVRCDVPAHVYQSTFEPNTQWTEEYAQGSEILRYWQGVARKYEVYKHLRANTNVLSLTWDEAAARWKIELEDVQTQRKYCEEFDVVIQATGRFNEWKLPEYPGIETFRNPLRHASHWDPDFDPQGESVAVIGNGASGIQLTTALQLKVSRLDHYARSPTWIAGSFAGEVENRQLEPRLYSAEQLKDFEDPNKYLEFRRKFESKFYRGFDSLFKGSEMNEDMRKQFKKSMAERLKDKPGLIEHLIPDFSPGCRRLTPGPGYLEALTKPNVDFIRTPISRFTEDSIITTDGVERKVDAVICCTGANGSMIPPYPITVPGSPTTTLRGAWTPDPITYIGTAVPSFPNFLLLSGPNSVGTSGTIPNQIETQTTYIAQLLRKVIHQRIKSFAPSQAATDDFMAYSDAFFAKTVWTEGCRTWANGGKPGARVHGHWPGSASHANVVRREPRWEDWEWTYRGGKNGGNRFGYLGGGKTRLEGVLDEEGEADLRLVGYLKRQDEVDLRRYHEAWFEA